MPCRRTVGNQCDAVPNILYFMAFLFKSIAWRVFIDEKRSAKKLEIIESKPNTWHMAASAPNRALR